MKGKGTKGRKQKEPAGMNPSEIFAALALLEQERGIPKAFMLDKITQAIVSAYKKDHPDTENVEVEADEEKQTLRMYVKKNVVDEEGVGKNYSSRYRIKRRRFFSILMRYQTRCPITSIEAE